MIRLLFGFILGVVASYYTFPMFYSRSGTDTKVQPGESFFQKNRH